MLRTRRNWVSLAPWCPVGRSAKIPVAHGTMNTKIDGIAKKASSINEVIWIVLRSKVPWAQVFGSEDSAVPTKLRMIWMKVRNEEKKKRYFSLFTRR